MNRSEANRPRKHYVCAGLDADGEALFSIPADVWPGDEVDIKLPNGLVLYMRVNADGFYEHR